MTELQPAEILVVKSGWLTTVQDLGRYGHQHDGLSVSGVMDSFSTIVANRLVGNPDQAAVLELTLKGPELQFEQDAVIAIAGADLSPTLDGRSIPMWERMLMPLGSRLRFGIPRAGARAYLAIAGGIDVPLELGSRSTHCASETGGLHGRALKPGDILTVGNPNPRGIQHIRTRLPDPFRPRYERSVALRIIPGPQEDVFLKKSITTLTGSTYTVSPHSNRMGYRLTGPTIHRNGSAQFISDGTATGALQIPPDGQPILLMADRQTTGGYPKIAVVISLDLPLAAQLAPGDRLRFVLCTAAQAQRLLRMQRAQLNAGLPPCDGRSQQMVPLSHHESISILRVSK